MWITITLIISISVIKWSRQSTSHTLGYQIHNDANLCVPGPCPSRPAHLCFSTVASHSVPFLPLPSAPDSANTRSCRSLWQPPWCALSKVTEIEGLKQDKKEGKIKLTDLTGSEEDHTPKYRMFCNSCLVPSVINLCMHMIIRVKSISHAHVSSVTQSSLIWKVTLKKVSVTVWQSFLK